MTDGDDPLELLGGDEAIFVGVKVLERLTKSFALQALHELRELVVIEDMATVPLAKVQFHPVAVMIVMVCGSEMDGDAGGQQAVGSPVKVEGDAVRADVLRIDFLEFVERDGTTAISVN